MNEMTENTMLTRVKTLITDRRILGVLAGFALMVIISLAFFWPDVAEGNVLIQSDTVQGIANSHETVTYRDSTGTTPRWTNALLGGMPTFQISPEYPSGAVISVARGIWSLGLPQPSNLLFIMMAGFFILLLAMKMRWYLALLGAIAYGFSSYFVIIIGAGHIWKFYTLAYIPPTIAGMVLAYRGRYLAGGALAALFATFQIAGNHIQMSYYFMMVVLGFAIAYLIILRRDNRIRQWLKATATLAVAAVLAVMANAPSLYNTYEYSRETIRGNHSDLKSANATSSKGLDKDYITAWSYGQSETLSLLIPNIKGGATIKPEKGSSTLLSLDKTDAAADLIARDNTGGAIRGITAQLPQYFGEQPMTNGPVYIGALIFALFLLGAIIVRGPIKWMLVIVTVISISLSWGHNMMWLTDIMIDYFPLYNKFRTVASILVVAEFTMPLLAVMALREVIDRRDEWKTALRRPAAISFGITLLLCFIGIAAPSFYGSYLTANEMQALGSVMSEPSYAPLFAAIESIRMSLVSADALRSFIIAGIGASLILLYWRRTLPSGAFVTAITLLVLFDLFSVDKRYVDHESFAPGYILSQTPVTPTAADKKILEDPDPNFRVMDLTRFNEATPSYFHKTIGGYHAAKLTRYQDMIDRHLSKFLGGEPGDADVNVLNMLNAKYLVMGDEVYPNPEALGNAWLVDEVVYVDTPDKEMDMLDIIDPEYTAVADKRFEPVLGEYDSKPAPGDTIYATSYSPDRLTYRAKTANGGVAVFSEVYFPWGWTATVDGNETGIARVDYLLRALRLPAGDHEIVMTFKPRSLFVTTIVASIGLFLTWSAVIAAIVLWFIRKFRKTEE